LVRSVFHKSLLAAAREKGLADLDGREKRNQEMRSQFPWSQEDKTACTWKHDARSSIFMDIAAP
jgi:hypothetical protein